MLRIKLFVKSWKYKKVVFFVKLDLEKFRLNWLNKVEMYLFIFFKYGWGKRNYKRKI